MCPGKLDQVVVIKGFRERGGTGMKGAGSWMMVTLHSAPGFNWQGSASKMLTILACWCFCCQQVIQRAWRSWLLLKVSDNYLSKDISWGTFSEQKGANLAFETLFQLGNTKWCVDLLVKTLCASEAALFTQTYALRLDHQYVHANQCICISVHPLLPILFEIGLNSGDTCWDKSQFSLVFNGLKPEQFQ